MRAQALVARNLRRLRVKHNLSQEALAADAGIDRTYVSRLERGLKTLPSRCLSSLRMPSVQRSSSSSSCRLLASLYRSRFEVVAGRSDSPELHRPTPRAERQAGQAGKAFDPGAACGAFGVQPPVHKRPRARPAQPDNREPL